MLSSVLLCTFVGPAAAGSGIPEVKAYLNGIDAPNVTSEGIFQISTFCFIYLLSFVFPWIYSFVNHPLWVWGPKPETLLVEILVMLCFLRDLKKL